MPSPVTALTATASATPIRRASARGGLVAVLVEVGLGQHERDRHAAGRRERGEALEPARLGVGQRLGDERQVDVRGQHVAAPARRARRARAGRSCRARSKTRAIAPPSSSADPVAGDGRLGQPPAGGDEHGSQLRVRPARGRGTARAPAQGSECNGGSPHHSKKRTRRRERAPGASARDPFSGSWRRCEGAASRPNGTQRGTAIPRLQQPLTEATLSASVCALSRRSSSLSTCRRAGCRARTAPRAARRRGQDVGRPLERGPHGVHDVLTGPARRAALDRGDVLRRARVGRRARSRSGRRSPRFGVTAPE